MHHSSDPFYEHLQLVAAVADAGVEPPEAWTALRQRHADFLALQYPVRDRLAAALIDGHPDDIGALKELAVAEQLGQTGNRATADIQDRVLHRMRDIYATAAGDNYRAVAALFDEAAQRFCATANTVDVEADAASMIAKAEKIRKAYLDAEGFANELTRLTVPLAAAATLASRHDVHPGDHLAVLPLVCDVDSGKRRTIWDAWDVGQQGRCGRWGALHRASITIRAADLNCYQQPYRRPLPVHREQRQKAGAPTGVIEWVTVDPEEQTPEPFDPVRRNDTGRAVAV